MEQSQSLTGQHNGSFVEKLGQTGRFTFVAVATNDAKEQAEASLEITVAEHDEKSLAQQVAKAETAKLSGDWREDIVAVAKTQTGYTASTTDYIFNSKGERKSYTVYGAEFDAAYSDWSAKFIAFCAKYAKVDLPRRGSVSELKSALSSVFEKPEDCEPAAGDVIFVRGDKKELAGIVTSASGSSVSAIMGDSEKGKVASASYSLSDSKLEGFANMEQWMIKAGKLEAEAEGDAQNEDGGLEPTDAPAGNEETAEPKETPNPEGSTAPETSVEPEATATEEPETTEEPEATEEPTATAEPTAEPDLVCGKEEHTHTNECYTWTGDAGNGDDGMIGATGGNAQQRVLTCGKEEHTHTSACYAICGKVAHTHDLSCYDAEGNLICGLEEHEHMDECKPVQLSDVETEDDSTGTVPADELKPKIKLTVNGKPYYENMEYPEGTTVTVEFIWPKEGESIPDGPIEEIRIPLTDLCPNGVTEGYVTDRNDPSGTAIGEFRVEDGSLILSFYDEYKIGGHDRSFSARLTGTLPLNPETMPGGKPHDFQIGDDTFNLAPKYYDADVALSKSMTQFQFTEDGDFTSTATITVKVNSGTTNGIDLVDTMSDKLAKAVLEKQLNFDVSYTPNGATEQALTTDPTAADGHYYTVEPVGNGSKSFDMTLNGWYREGDVITITYVVTVDGELLKESNADIAFEDANSVMLKDMLGSNTDPNDMYLVKPTIHKTGMMYKDDIIQWKISINTGSYGSLKGLEDGKLKEALEKAGILKDIEDQLGPGLEYTDGEEGNKRTWKWDDAQVAEQQINGKDNDYGIVYYNYTIVYTTKITKSIDGGYTNTVSWGDFGAGGAGDGGAVVKRQLGLTKKFIREDDGAMVWRTEVMLPSEFGTATITDTPSNGLKNEKQGYTHRYVKGTITISVDGVNIANNGGIEIDEDYGNGVKITFNGAGADAAAYLGKTLVIEYKTEAVDASDSKKGSLDDTFNWKNDAELVVEGGPLQGNAKGSDSYENQGRLNVTKEVKFNESTGVFTWYLVVEGRPMVQVSRSKQGASESQEDESLIFEELYRDLDVDITDEIPENHVLYGGDPYATLYVWSPDQKADLSTMRYKTFNGEPGLGLEDWIKEHDEVTTSVDGNPRNLKLAWHYHGDLPKDPQKFDFMMENLYKNFSQTAIGRKRVSLTFVYQTKIGDTSKLYTDWERDGSANPTVNFTNNVEYTVNGRTDHTSATQAYPIKILEKTSRYDSNFAQNTKDFGVSNGKVNLFFSVDINKDKLVETLDENAKITVTDTLGEGLRLLPRSVKLSYGEGTRKEVDRTQANIRFEYNPDTRTFTLSNIPAGTYYVLTYWAELVKGEMGKPAEDASNNITLSLNGKKVSDSTNYTGDILGSNASGTSNGFVINIVKFTNGDPDVGYKPLSGAEFVLDYGTLNQNGTFERVEALKPTGTTDETGTTNDDGNLSYTFNDAQIAMNYIFRLKETKSPAGYNKLSEPKYFVLADSYTGSELWPEGIDVEEKEFSTNSSTVELDIPNEPLKAKIKGTKNFEPSTRTWTNADENQYSFTLESVTPETPMPSETTATAKNVGEITFPEINFAGVEKETYYYTITENELPEDLDDKMEKDSKTVYVRITVDSTQPNEANRVKVEYSDNANFEPIITDPEGFTFTNTEYAAVDAPLAVEKKVDGPYAGPQKTFTFDVAPNGDTPTDTIAEKTSVEVTYPIPGSSTVEKFFHFTKTGTYSYTVTERSSDDNGWTNDTSEWTITFVVVKGEGNSKALEVKSTTYAKDGNQQSDATAATFTNIYKPTSTEYVPKVTKTITGTTPGNSDKTFTFTLAPANNNPAGATLPENTTATVTGAGTANFDDITFTAAGTYNFTISEQKPDPAPAGWTYDTSSWTLTVEVTDNNGQLKVKGVTYSDGKEEKTGENAAAEFVNNYKPNGTEFTPSVTKNVTGDMAAAKTFDFTIIASEGNSSGAKLKASTRATVTVNPDGTTEATIPFGGIEFTEAGTYYFTISEVKPEPVQAGWEYDNAQWTLTVVVTDKGGQLEVTSSSYKNGNTSNEQAASFENKYTPAATEFNPRVKKTVTGYSDDKNLKNRSFQFTLSGTDEASQALIGNNDQTITITGADLDETGNCEKYFFDSDVQIEKAGTYYFTIKETHGSVDGFQYDTMPWKLTVVVSDDGNGQLTATTTYSRGETESTTEAEFTNTYTRPKTEVSVEKQWIDENGDPEDGDHPAIEVQLIQTASKVVDERTTISSHSIIRTEWLNSGNNWQTKWTDLDKYDAEDNPYTYTVEEVGVPDGYVKSVVSDETGEFTYIIKNTFTPVSVKPQVSKTVVATGSKGGTDLSQHAFTFTLVAESDNAKALLPNSQSITLAVEKWDEAMTAEFNGIKFTAPGEYTFEIREALGDDDGYVYDAAIWTLTVTVSKAGDGTLSAETNYAPGIGSESNATAAKFTNEYDVTSIQVEKIWDDNENSEGFRPESVTVQLVQWHPVVPGMGNPIGEAVVLDEDNGWSHEWNDLPVRRPNGDEIKYGVIEVDIPAGYTDKTEQTSEPGEQPIKFTITNTHETEKVALSVQKVWNIPEGITQPTSVTVQLFKNGTAYEHGKMTLNNSTGWKYTWNDLPKYEDGKEIVYNIEETDVPEGYEEEVSLRKATAGGKTSWSFTVTNTYRPTEVSMQPTVRKNIGGSRPSGADANESFTFHIELTNGDAHGVEWWGWNPRIAKRNGEGEVSFSKIIFKKPGTYEFTIREEAGSNHNYKYDGSTWTWTVVVEDKVEPIGELEIASATYRKNDDPSIEYSEDDAVAVFTNDYTEPGSLSVTKTVTGSLGDTSRAWNFTVTLDNKSINGWYGNMLFTDGTATFTLKHGESKTATNLPAGVEYTVTEAEANADGYTTEVTGKASDKIPTGSTASVAFTNDKSGGDLTVTKTVTGGDTTRDWNFTVTLSDDTVNGTYGGMTFTNGVATFTLKHGESKTANGLPAGVTYAVTETEANQGGYTTSASDATGTITDGGTATAAFNNYRPTPTPTTTSRTVRKVWMGDNNNATNSRPQSIQVQLYRNGAPYGSAVTLTSPGWSYTWYGLDISDASGAAYDYTVGEVGSVPGYSASVNGFTITNTYESPLTSRTVNKVWADVENLDGSRPGSIQVQLYENNVAHGSAVTLNADNGWTHTWSNLPVYNASGEINYRVAELNVPAGYTQTTTANGTTFTITNTHTPGPVNIAVVKAWNDGENKDELRPESVTVQLEADGAAQGQPVTLSAANGWAYSWTNLPSNENGRKIEYTVRELNVPEKYTATVTSATSGATTTYTITNTYEPMPDFRDLEGTKVWIDQGNALGIRPDAIEVRLYQNGALMQDQVPEWTKEANSWHYRFTQLPYADANHQPYSYTVQEVPVAGYTTQIEGTTIINTLAPETMTINGTKTWRDNNNADGIRPTRITVRLLRDGTLYQEKTVTAAGGWRYSFTDLPVSDPATGHVYRYEISERVVTGYYVQVDGYNLINVELPRNPGNPDNPPTPRDTTPTPPGDEPVIPIDEYEPPLGITEVGEPPVEELEDLVELMDYDTPLWGELLGTGDDLPAYPFVFGGIGLLAVLALILDRKKRKKEQ